MKYRILSFVIIAFLLCLWECLSAADALIPPPSKIYEAFLETLENGILFSAIIDSLRRFFIGFVIGSFLAVCLGLILGRYKVFEILLEPLLQFFRPISPIAWLPVLALLFGIGELGAICVIIYAVFFPVLFLSIMGVRQINPTILKMADNFKASEFLIFKSIILPGAFLHIASGLKLAASIAWIHLVAGEMLGIQSGLGYMIIDGRNTLRYDLVMLAVFFIGLFGFLIHLGFSALEKVILKKLGGLG